MSVVLQLTTLLVAGGLVVLAWLVALYVIEVAVEGLWELAARFWRFFE